MDIQVPCSRGIMTPSPVSDSPSVRFRVLCREEGTLVYSASLAALGLGPCRQVFLILNGTLPYSFGVPLGVSV